MRRSVEIAVVVASGLALVAGSPRSARADGAAFEGLGALGPGEVSEAYDVSADGSAVIGYGTFVDPFLGLGQRAVRWTRATGLQSLGVVGFGFFGSAASGVSGDGLTVVGVSGAQGFRWIAPGPMNAVGTLPGQTSAWARAASFDGSVVVGDSGNGFTAAAFRSLSAGPLQPLGALAGGDATSSATDVSADGSVIVGQASSALGTEAFRWTSSAGMVGMGLFAGAVPGDISRAQSVSADGSVTVGFGTLDHVTLAFRAIGAGPLESLGDLPGGDTYSSARGVSGDGAIIVGESARDAGVTGFIWTATDGMLAFDDYLFTQFGISLDGWSITSVNGVSADGRAFVGSGINPQGLTEAWRVIIPAPAGVPLLACAGTLAARRRRR